jgi:hypothetical protein
VLVKPLSVKSRCLSHSCLPNPRDSRCADSPNDAEESFPPAPSAFTRSICYQSPKRGDKTISNIARSCAPAGVINNKIHIWGREIFEFLFSISPNQQDIFTSLNSNFPLIRNPTEQFLRLPVIGRFACTKR